MAAPLLTRPSELLPTRPFGSAAGDGWRLSTCTLRGKVPDNGSNAQGPENPRAIHGRPPRIGGCLAVPTPVRHGRQGRGHTSGSTRPTSSIRQLSAFSTTVRQRFVGGACAVAFAYARVRTRNNTT